MSSHPQDSAKYWDAHFHAQGTFTESVLGFYDFRRAKVFSPFLGARSLEIGPGIGLFAQFADVTDVLDVSQASLARVQALKPSLRTYHYDKLPLPFADASFDSVICNDVIHHVKETTSLGEYFREIHRILKPTGHFLISDRKANWINRVCLQWSGWGRRVFLKLKPGTLLSGGDVELPMEHADYDELYGSFLPIAVRDWKSLPVWCLITTAHFAFLVLPMKLLLPGFLKILGILEDRLQILAMDHYLVLRKK